MGIVECLDLPAFEQNELIYGRLVNVLIGMWCMKVLSLQHLEESLDPTIELTRLVSEGKLEEAFNKALSLSDVAIVSWLCMQVCYWACNFLLSIIT